VAQDTQMLMRKDPSSLTRAIPSSHLLKLAEAHHNLTAMVFLSTADTLFMGN
jgi:hypothetical protein